MFAFAPRILSGLQKRFLENITYDESLDATEALSSNCLSSLWTNKLETCQVGHSGDCLVMQLYFGTNYPTSCSDGRMT